MKMLSMTTTSLLKRSKKKGQKLIIDALKAKLDHEAQTIASIQESTGKEVDALPVLHQVVRSILLRNIDKLWQEHLLSIDHLRTEVNMRVVGQKRPSFRVQT